MSKKTNLREPRVLADGAMKIDDAVQWSGIGRSRLYAAMSSGQLAFVRFGRRRLIPRRSLEDFLSKYLEDGNRG